MEVIRDWISIWGKGSLAFIESLSCSGWKIPFRLSSPTINPALPSQPLNFPSRRLSFQWLFYLPSAEVAFIEQLCSHQMSGTLIYKEDPQRLGCRSPDMGIYCQGCAAHLNPAPTPKPRAGCWQPACSARTHLLSGKKTTKH